MSTRLEDRSERAATKAALRFGLPSQSTLPAGLRSLSLPVRPGGEKYRVARPARFVKTVENGNCAVREWEPVSVTSRKEGVEGNARKGKNAGGSDYRVVGRTVDE